MQFVLNLFHKWGLWAVFLLIFLEYACFPIPSEVVLPFAGFISNKVGNNLFLTLLISVFFGYIGSLVCYFIGYYGGNYIFDKIYNKFKGWRKGLDNSKAFFDKYGNTSVMIGRIVPLCRTYISFFAGLFRQNFFSYSLFSCLGICVWNTILVSLGYYLGDNWEIIAIYYNKYKYLFVIMFVLIFILFCLIKYKKKKREKNIIGD